MEEEVYKERLRSHSSSGKSSTGTPKENFATQLEVIEDILENPTSSQKKKKKKKMAEKKKVTDLDTLADLITSLTTTVNDIKSDVTTLKGNQDKLTSVEKKVINYEDTLKTTKELAESDSLKIKLLSAIVIKQEARIEQLERTVNNMQKAEKRPNLIISGLNENAEASVTDRITLANEFFKNQMEIETEIKVQTAYWIGNHPNRNLLIKLMNPEDKATIFSHVSNLKGKKNARRKLFFINDDQLEEDRELRSYYKQLVKENNDREDDRKLKIHLRKGKLLVNNKIISPKVYAPAPADILTLEPKELDALQHLKTYEAGRHKESGSEFICCFQRVSSVNDVQQGLARMKIKHGDATHIVTAYKLQHADGPFRQGFQDNKESGAGWKMLTELKDKDQDNIAVFIARFSDGSKMGPRRFDVYKDLTRKAVKKLREKMDKLARVNRLRRSSSQLSQLSQFSASQEELNNQETELMNTKQKEVTS